MRADSNPRSAACAAFGRAFCGALLLVVAGNALSLPGRRFVGRYDFGYAIRGDRPARPAQVFDDGSGKVFFEARPNQTMPAVFAGKELALLVLQPEGQYFTARTAASEFTLVLAGARAQVRRGDAALGEEVVTPQDGGGGRLLATAESGLTTGVDYGATTPRASGARATHEQPVVFAPGSATLKPEVLDALTALVVRIGRDTNIAAVGRNDAGAGGALATLRAEALRNALLARGVAASRVRLVDDDPAVGEERSHASVLRWLSTEPAREPLAALEAATPFDITLADGDIAVALRRWAHASGYDLVWDVDWVAPVNGALRVEAPSFLDAIKQVAAGLRAQGYPVQAQAYADHVVRFTAAR